MGIAGKCVLTQDEIGIREHLVIVAGLQKSKYTRFEVRDFYSKYCI